MIKLTLQSKHKRLPISITNRVDSFINSNLKTGTYMKINLQHENLENKNGIRSPEEINYLIKKNLEDSYKAFQNECNRVLYVPSKPIIPYPHLSKEITPFGFVRDELTLP